MHTNPGGLVFYSKQTFDAAGYTVPSTWDELIALSNQMVADGQEPRCFNWEAGFASGFAGSDFLDSLVLRVAGAEVYDGCASGEFAFDDPRIVEAAELGNELLFGSGLVAGGSESISSSLWQYAALRMLDENPLPENIGSQCWLGHMSAQPTEHRRAAQNPRRKPARNRRRAGRVRLRHGVSTTGFDSTPFGVKYLVGKVWSSHLGKPSEYLGNPRREPGNIRI